MKSKKRQKKHGKFNLVPILDSVYIFISFILMSAPFVDVYEICSSVPMTQEVTNKMDKDPLNLILEVNREKLIVKTGLKTEEVRDFTIYEPEKLRNHLTELENKYPKELTETLEKTKQGNEGDNKKKVTTQHTDVELMNLILNKDIDYEKVQRMMHGSSLAGYDNFKFIVKGSY